MSASLESTSDSTALLDYRRYEIKFTTLSIYADALTAGLRAICFPDPDHPENIVNTLYFDTPDLSAYREKQDGHYIKNKIRLRWYDETATRTPGDDGSMQAWIECKSKHGSAGQKTRHPVTIPRSILSLPAFDPSLLTAALAKHTASDALRPTVWLEYRRSRMLFADNQYRIAVDSDITPKWAPEILPGHAANLPLQFAVVEIKGPSLDYPEPLSRLIGRFARQSAISKYEMCLNGFLEGSSFA